MGWWVSGPCRPRPPPRAGAGARGGGSKAAPPRARAHQTVFDLQSAPCFVKCTDANTAILYAYSVWIGSGSRDTKAAFLFTLKFDADGNSKIVKTQKMPDKDIED